MYTIKKYSYDQAKKLKVDIRPSHFKNKKIDVFKGDVFICSIGDSRYNHYTYLKINKELADKRRMLYHQRHKKDNIENTKGYYALHILW